MLRHVHDCTTDVRRRPLLVGCLSLAVVSASAYTCSRRTSRHNGRAHSPKRWLHPLAVQAISGAVAEVCENLIGYPFSTLRVKCQAHNLSTWAVLRQLQGSKRAAIKTLYSGVGPTTLGAVVVGAMYLSSFTFLNEWLYEARQQAAQRAAERKRHSRSARTRRFETRSPAANDRDDTRSKTRSSNSSSSSRSEQQRAYCEQSKHGRRQQRQATNSAAGRRAEADCLLHPADMVAPSRLLTDFVAAALASISTALIEGPLDVFQNRIQAGSASGGRHSSISMALRNGIGPLFSGLNGFLLRGITRDVAELVAYSQLRELKNPQLTGQVATRVQKLPDEVADMILGASAGALAVLLSMPLTCIKTVIDTRAAVPPSGLLPTINNFWVTGNGILQAGGPAALFRGFLPQMVETIPSVGMYWLAVECTRRTLAPYTIKNHRNLSAVPPITAS